MSSTQVTKQKPGSTPRGQQRAFAFENLVPLFQPGNFSIQILTPDFQPLKGLGVEATTSEATFEGTTNQDGLVKIRKPLGGQVTLLVKSSESGEDDGATSGQDTGEQPGEQRG